MHAAGLAAYEKREDARSGIYSFEQNKEVLKLDAASEKLFKSNKKAWKNFNAMPSWHIRTASWHVIKWVILMVVNCLKEYCGILEWKKCNNFGKI